MVCEALLGCGMAGHRVLLTQMKGLMLTQALLCFCHPPFGSVLLCHIQSKLEQHFRILKQLCWCSCLLPRKQGGSFEPSPCVSVLSHSHLS